ncbi:hypothetical protein [Oleiharenicola lentus]|uniref:hypothetical protein n=1 Tax=Oleiharenicola lentus TaxID=2508720 RepID=UPI003F673CBA
MSDEQVPRLRLKPKLAADPHAAAPETAAPEKSHDETVTTPAPEAPLDSLVPPSSDEAPKFVRLKPRLSVAPPAEQVTGTLPAEVPPSPELVTPAAPIASPAVSLKPASGEPAADAPKDKPMGKFSLRPKAIAPVTPPKSSTTPPITAEAAKVAPLSMPVPPSPGTAAVDTGEEGEPAEITAIRQASSSPFPPPTAQFPTPGAKDGASGAAVKGKSGGSRKMVLALLLVVVAGGGYFAYTHFLAEPAPEPLPPRKLAANPTTAQGQAVAKVQDLTKQAEAQVNATVNEIMPDEAAKAAASNPATTPNAVSTAPSPNVIGATPPPAPAPVASIAFKGWVENLRIGAVVGGTTPKVFIGSTAYVVGDLVNPQLGILFESYHLETRTLTFRDRTGARVTKRN